MGTHFRIALHGTLPLRRAHQRGLLRVLAVAVLAIGGGACETNDKADSNSPEEASSEEEGESVVAVRDSMAVRVYFHRGEQIGVAARMIPSTKAVASEAMRELLSGPTALEIGYGLGSAIPASTELRSLSIDSGTATIDLSDEYDAGGGTLSMTMRLAQVVYTLTQFPTIERVLFQIEGTTVGAFGGEGILIGEPQTRDHFEQVTPAILLESPAPGESVTSPLRIEGTANTFEAAFMARILSGGGDTLIETPMMATSGSGTRGTFDAVIPFTVDAPGMISLSVFEYSAKDGSPIHIVEIPLRLSTDRSPHPK